MMEIKLILEYAESDGMRGQKTKALNILGEYRKLDKLDTGKKKLFFNDTFFYADKYHQELKDMIDKRDKYKEKLYESINKKLMQFMTNKYKYLGQLPRSEINT